MLLFEGEFVTRRNGACREATLAGPSLSGDANAVVAVRGLRSLIVTARTPHWATRTCHGPTVALRSNRNEEPMEHEHDDYGLRLIDEMRAEIRSEMAAG